MPHPLATSPIITSTTIQCHPLQPHLHRPAAKTRAAPRRTAQDCAAVEYHYLRAGAARGFSKTILFNPALRCLGFGRGLCVAGRTQTTRSANQDRTSTCAEYSFAQPPPSQIILVVGRTTRTGERRNEMSFCQIFPETPASPTRSTVTHWGSALVTPTQSSQAASRKYRKPRAKFPAPR